MTYSPFTATGDGTTTAYTIAFDYLDTTDVKARVNDVVTTAFTVSGSTVTFTTAPPSGQSIKIYRDTDNATIQADFQSGSALRAVDLNSNFTQLLYVTQESTDISDTAESDSATALSTANTALSTANTASSNASTALSTANSASSSASTNASNITTNTSNISTNTSNISTNTSNISTNTSNISTNTSNISTNTSDIATNTSNISTNTSNISTNTTNIATKMPKAGGTFTGAVSFDDDVIIKGDSTNAGKLTLNCEDNVHAVNIQGPPHSAAASYTLTLPTGTGSNGNSLITDGSGGLSWGSPTADVSNKADVDSPTFTGTPAAPTATQGTNTTQIATTAFVNAEIAADTVNLAPKASPTFTGIPAAPTASAGTNTTQLATTQFVTSAVNDKAPLLSPSLTGTPTAPTANSGTNTTQIATTAFVDAAVSPKANTASPTLTGTPAAPTAAVDTNTTQIATTEFVQTQIAADATPLNSPAFTGTPTAPTAAQGTSTTQLATTAFVNAEIAADTANLAPKASPTFTGTPTAPTAASGTNNTQLATTAYVDGAVSGKADLASPAFTGTPTAPISSNSDSNGTAIATTAWVNSKIDNASITYGIQKYDPDITKNDVANTFTAKQTLDDIHVGGAYTAGTLTSISPTQGNYFIKEYTTGTTLINSFGTIPQGTNQVYSFTLQLKLNGGTVTAWPSNVKWAGGTTPTFTANKTHLVFFVTPDNGTTFYGSAITDFTH